MSSTSEALLSARHKAKQLGQTFYFCSTDFNSGRRLTEPIQEEDDMSDHESSEIASPEGSDTTEWDTEDTQSQRLPHYGEWKWQY